MGFHIVALQDEWSGRTDLSVDRLLSSCIIVRFEISHCGVLFFLLCCCLILYKMRFVCDLMQVCISIGMHCIFQFKNVCLWLIKNNYLNKSKVRHFRWKSLSHLLKASLNHRFLFELPSCWSLIVNRCTWSLFWRTCVVMLTYSAEPSLPHDTFCFAVLSILGI